jgi:hypothetical protein
MKQQTIPVPSYVTNKAQSNDVYVAIAYHEEQGVYFLAFLADNMEEAQKKTTYLAGSYICKLPDKPTHFMIDRKIYPMSQWDRVMNLRAFL